MLFGNPLTGILINIERVVVKVWGVTHLQLLHLIFPPAVFSSAHPNAALGAAVASVTLPPIAALLRARARVADMRQAEPDLVLIQPVFISLSLPRTRKHARTRSHALPRFVVGFFFCVLLPLGMALSVSLLPLRAFSSSLVLSWVAFTRSFSPATLSAFPTNMHTRKKMDTGNKANTFSAATVTFDAKAAKET